MSTRVSRMLIVNDPLHIWEASSNERCDEIWTVRAAVMAQAGPMGVVAHDLLTAIGPDLALTARSEAVSFGQRLWEILGLHRLHELKDALAATSSAACYEARPLLESAFLGRAVGRWLADEQIECSMTNIRVVPIKRSGPIPLISPSLGAFQAALAAATRVRQIPVPTDEAVPGPLRKEVPRQSAAIRYGRSWLSATAPRTVILHAGLRPNDLLDLLAGADPTSSLQISELASVIFEDLIAQPALRKLGERTDRCVHAAVRDYSGEAPEIFGSSAFVLPFQVLARELVAGRALAQALKEALTILRPAQLTMGMDNLIRERLLEDAARRSGVHVHSVVHGGYLPDYQDLIGQPDTLWVWGAADVRGVRSVRPELKDRLEVVGSATRGGRSVTSEQRSLNRRSNRIILLTSPAALGVTNLQSSPTATLATWNKLVDLAKEHDHLEFIIRTHPAHDDVRLYEAMAGRAPNLSIQARGPLSSLLPARLAVMVQIPSSALLDAAGCGLPTVHLSLGLYPDQAACHREVGVVVNLEVPDVAQLAELIRSLDVPAAFDAALARTEAAARQVVAPGSSGSAMATALRRVPERRAAIRYEATDEPSFGAALAGGILLAPPLRRRGSIVDRKLATLTVLRRSCSRGPASFVRQLLWWDPATAARFFLVRSTRRELLKLAVRSGLELKPVVGTRRRWAATLSYRR